MSAALNQLSEACESGSYYDALQHFKSIFSRKLKSPKGTVDDSFDLLKNGVRICATACQTKPECGAAMHEIAKQLIPVFQQYRIPFGEKALLMIKEVSVFMELSHEGFVVTEEEPQPETQNQPIHYHIDFLQTMFKWSKEKKTEQDPELDASPMRDYLHRELARVHQQCGQTVAAYKHLILTEGTGDLVRLVREMYSKGNRYDMDLFVGRAALQLLCCVRKGGTEAAAEGSAMSADCRKSITVCKAYLKSALGVLKVDYSALIETSPLLHFLKYFILALERRDSEAVDGLLRFYGPLELKARDEKIFELAVQAANAHGCTTDHKRSSSDGNPLSMILSMLSNTPPAVAAAA